MRAFKMRKLNIAAGLVAGSIVAISSLSAYAVPNAFSDSLDMSNHKITRLGYPTVAADAASKQYVDDQLGGGGTADNLGNHTATQILNMSNFNISHGGYIYGTKFLDQNNAIY